MPLRFDAVCRKCGSAERHRQHQLLLRDNEEWITNADVLHFAAERCFVEDYLSRAKSYCRADRLPGRGEVKVDIQKMYFQSSSFDTIICHQILEHVPDDAAAIREMYRVIRPGGRVILSVPIVENWNETFVESVGASDEVTRDLYFGQGDHVRYYGNDFARKISAGGFEVAEYIAHEPSVSRFGLIRGHKIFVASKRSI